MSDTKVITGKVRFSYANVFNPKAIEEGQKEKYSVSILIPKKDKITLNKINAAVAAATEAGKTSKFGGRIPANLKLPLRDGDIDRPEDEAYAGCFFINANSVRKPAVVDANVDPIMDQDEFYSGCYGRAAINFYPYNEAGSKGIAAGLQNLQKLEDGEKLAGGSTAKEDFGDEDNAFM